MGDQTAIRRGQQPPKRSPRDPVIKRSELEAGDAAKVLQALEVAYDRVVCILYDRIDRSKADMNQISILGRRLGWASDRQRLVKSVLRSGPLSIDYICADCSELNHIRSLAEMAIELAGEGESLSTALSLLYYIDRELGWEPLTKDL